MVMSLRQSNPEPKIVGEPPDQTAIFPDDFDWTEQDRVAETIKRLAENPAKEWDSLLEGSKNEEYCITFELDQSIRNYSIGAICSLLLKESITASYMDVLPKRDIAIRKLRNPKYIPIKRDEFVKWCMTRQKEGATLVDLQVEASEWAAMALGQLPEIEKQEKANAIDKINIRIAQLRSSNQPIPMQRFMRPDFRSTISRERGHKMRFAPN